MKTPKSTTLAALLALAASAFAQDGAITPYDAPEEPNAIPLNTGGVENQPASESWFFQWGEPMVRNVTEATLTPFLPNPDKATGAAVLVAPGGGFRWLSINNEGWKIAKALNEQGVAAFVLKYRLNPTPPTLEGLRESMNRTFTAATPTAEGEDAPPPPPRPRWNLDNQLEDAEAAYAMIIDRAEEWGVDTDRIGMMGFSAGAGLTMHCTMNSKTMNLAFIAPIYGGMGAVEVPDNAPPLYVAIAANDFLFNGDFGLIESWYKAGKSVEFHLYQDGGHGFGRGYPGHTTYWWFDSFVHWLDINGYLKPKSAE